MKEIKNRVVNIKGKEYTIREISIDKKELLNIGNFFAETKREKSEFFGDEDGVYIYQSYLKPNIGYRIYKEFADYGFDGYDDDKLIARLSEKQKYIKKSNFPTGILTLNGKIIGQEIKLFLNHQDANVYSMENRKIIPTYIYRQILDILKEMYDSNIAYLDGHSKNFVVNRNSGHVQIIDFEWDKMEFDTITESSNWKIFNNLNSLINSCNENYEINDILDIAKLNSFDEAYQYLLESEDKLIKSKRYYR